MYFPMQYNSLRYMFISTLKTLNFPCIHAVTDRSPCLKLSKSIKNKLYIFWLLFTYLKSTLLFKNKGCYSCWFLFSKKYDICIFQFLNFITWVMTRSCINNIVIRFRQHIGCQTLFNCKWIFDKLNEIVTKSS